MSLLVGLNMALAAFSIGVAAFALSLLFFVLLIKSHSNSVTHTVRLRSAIYTNDNSTHIEFAATDKSEDSNSSDLVRTEKPSSIRSVAIFNSSNEIGDKRRSSFADFKAKNKSDAIQADKKERDETVRRSGVVKDISDNNLELKTIKPLVGKRLSQTKSSR